MFSLKLFEQNKLPVTLDSPAYELLGGFVIVGRGYNARIEFYILPGDGYMAELSITRHATKHNAGFGGHVQGIGDSTLGACVDALRKMYVPHVDWENFCGCYGAITHYMGNDAHIYHFGRTE